MPYIEFHDLWHGLEVPNDVDLLKALASEGLQATASAAAPVPRAGAQKKKRPKSSTSLLLDSSALGVSHG